LRVPSMPLSPVRDETRSPPGAVGTPLRPHRRHRSRCDRRTRHLQYTRPFGAYSAPRKEATTAGRALSSQCTRWAVLQEQPLGPYFFARFPRHTGLTPRLRTPDICHQRHNCHVCVASCPVSATSASCQVQHAPRALSNSGPVKSSALPEGSLRFRPLPRPSSVFSLFLCLCITWTILRPFPCTNSGPFSLPVPHLSLFWLWAQVSLHLYIVRDLLTSGFGHRSASAQVAFDIPHSSSLVRCTSARDRRRKSIETFQSRQVSSVCFSLARRLSRSHSVWNIGCAYGRKAVSQRVSSGDIVIIVFGEPEHDESEKMIRKCW
jgi:hypothetical protein